VSGTTGAVEHGADREPLIPHSYDPDGPDLPRHFAGAPPAGITEEVTWQRNIHTLEGV
jgi:hypothetical protein